VLPDGGRAQDEVPRLRRRNADDDEVDIDRIEQAPPVGLDPLVVELGGKLVGQPVVDVGHRDESWPEREVGIQVRCQAEREAVRASHRPRPDHPDPELARPAHAGTVAVISSIVTRRRSVAAVMIASHRTAAW
jgi:hypothetical protein